MPAHHRLLTAMACLAAACAIGAPVQPARATDYIYTDNDTVTTNTVTVFSGSANGTLTNLATFNSGGAGCGGDYALYALSRIKAGAVKHGGDVLLVANDCSSNFTVFSGAATGNLVAVTTVPSTGGAGFSVSSNGNCIIVANDDGELDSYVYPKFTTPASTVYMLGGQTDGLTVSSKFVASVNVMTDQINIVPVSATCKLGKISSFYGQASSVGGTAAGVALNAANTVLYVGDANVAGATIVEAFSIPSGTPLSGSPFVYPASAGSNSNIVVLGKSGKCLYVSNQYSSSITKIQVLAGGALAPSSSNAPTGGTSATGLAFDPTSTILYVADLAGGVSAEVIGKPTKTNPCPVTLGPNPDAPTNSFYGLISLSAF